MGKTKSKEQLSAENKALKTQIRGNSISKILSTAIKWTGLYFVASTVSECIGTLAGKITVADIKFGAELFTIECKWALTLGTVVAFLGGAVGVFGFFYGKWQLKLKKDVIESKDDRIRALEARLDPRRSSSGLTSRGDTRKEDRE